MERLTRWIHQLSIGAKLQIGILVTATAVLVLVLLPLASSHRNQALENGRDALLLVADGVARYVSVAGPTGELAGRLQAFKSPGIGMISVIDGAGRLLAVTGHDKDLAGKAVDALTDFASYYPRANVNTGKRATLVTTRPTDGEIVLCAYAPVPETGGTVVVDRALSDLTGPANDFITRLILLSLVGLGLVALVIHFISARVVTRPMRALTKVFEEISKENYQARATVTGEDELGRMSQGLNAMLDKSASLLQSSAERDTMQGSIMNLLEEISGLAEGDLTVRAEVTEDFTGAIADSFNEMAGQLSEVVRNVKNVTLQVIATAQQVTRSTENLAETSEMQAMQVSEAISAINGISTAIQQVAENAVRCANVSEQSTQHAKEGVHAVRETNRAMESIREHAQETARAIKRLGESSQEVGNIVQLINDIADRTSILALNASIQAAMAGDAGRGFAVVAEEVQRLAERSTDATKQIDTLIKNIQGEITEAGASMEESIQRVVEGSRLADGARNKLQEIETVSSQLGALIQAISQSSKQQARASEEIAKTMEEVGEISSQTSVASRQTAVSMKSLAQMSSQLNESVSVFRLEEDA